MTNIGVERKEKDSNLAIYLREINKIPILSREEELAIAGAAVTGSKSAREKLVTSNLRFVVNVAKKYQGFGLPLEDLIGEGNTGLLNAVDRFDVKKGYHFISYAVWWIRQAIISALYEKARMIRLPVNRAAELVKIEKARKQVKMNTVGLGLNSNPEEEIMEIAKLLKMDKDHVSDLLNISREMLSLENPVSREKNVLLRDFIEENRYKSPEKQTEQNLMKTDIENALNTLDKHEADILRWHYGLGRRPMSFKEIGVRYNLSKERVRQIEERALSRLRNPSRTARLQAYVA